jgi:hypothetical protein
VEVERLLLVGVEEAENLDENLTHLGVELDVVFGFLTNTVREEFEGLVNLLVTVLL